MNKKFVKVLAAVTVSSVLATNVSYADQVKTRKNETIYVTKDSGEIKDKTVSVWINADKNVKIKDKSDLKEIKNLETDEKIDPKDGFINWNSDNRDVYYQGKTNKDLPVDVNVSYKLDGKEVKFEDLKGATGHLQIIIDAKNKTKKTLKINGADKEVFSPYIVATEISFDVDKAINIKADDSKVVKDGKNQIVASILTPGLKENFDGIVDSSKLDKFKDHVEIEVDVENYEPTEVYTVITNEVFQDDLSLASFDDLDDGINELTTNADKLVDASAKLADGGRKLNDGIGDLSNGSEKLSQGSEKLQTSYQQFANAFADLPEKIKPISSAVNQLNQGGSSLNQGINQYTQGVSQINENMAKLNKAADDIESGAAKLDGGLEELSKGTAMLREKVGAGTDSDGLDKLSTSLVSLKDGLDDFYLSVDPLSKNLDELSTGIAKLDESGKGLGQGIEKLNQTAQNAPSVKGSIEDIEAKATAIEGIANSLETKDADGSYADEIYTLREIESGLYAEAENLKASAQVTGALSQGLAGLDSGYKELTAGIAKASQGSKQMSEKVNASKSQLLAASEKLAKGVSKIDQGLSNSDMAKLTDAIVKLDEGTKNLKDGSAKLLAGTSQNKDGVRKLAQAMGSLDSKSPELISGSEKLSSGLAQFEQRSKALSSLGDINEKAINPMGKGINDLNEGINKLREGALRLKEGSGEYVGKYDEFNQGLKDYKTQGIDKLSEKTGDLDQAKEILDKMSDLAKENNSISGSTDDFETRSRIIEKIK